MKYIKYFVLAAFLFVGCGNKSEKNEDVKKPQDNFQYDTSDVKTTPVENPNESFLLRYNFEKGKDYKYRITNISEDHQTIKADTTVSQNVKQTIIYLVNLNLNSTDQDSVNEFNCTISSVKLDADANNQHFSYQSGVTKDSAELDKYVEYEALINNPFALRISKTGEILEIFRADKIVSKFLDMKGFADSVTTDEKLQLRQNIVDGAIKPLMVQLFRQIPENQTAKDSAWSFTQPPSQFMVFKMQNTYKYKITGLEKMNSDKIAVINATLDTKVEGKTKITERGANYEFEKPKTTANGKIYFNVTNGMLQKSKTQTTVDVSFTMEMPTPAR